MLSKLLGSKIARFIRSDSDYTLKIGLVSKRPRHLGVVVIVLLCAPEK